MKRQNIYIDSLHHWTLSNNKITQCTRLSYSFVCEFFHHPKGQKTEYNFRIGVFFKAKNNLLANL